MSGLSLTSLQSSSQYTFVPLFAGRSAINLTKRYLIDVSSYLDVTFACVGTGFPSCITHTLSLEYIFPFSTGIHIVHGSAILGYL